MSLQMKWFEYHVRRKSNTPSYPNSGNRYKDPMFVLAFVVLPPLGLPHLSVFILDEKLFGSFPHVLLRCLLLHCARAIARPISRQKCGRSPSGWLRMSSSLVLLVFVLEHHFMSPLVIHFVQPIPWSEMWFKICFWARVQILVKFVSTNTSARAKLLSRSLHVTSRLQYC